MSHLGSTNRPRSKTLKVRRFRTALLLIFPLFLTTACQDSPGLVNPEFPIGEPLFSTGGGDPLPLGALHFEDFLPEDHGDRFGRDIPRIHEGFDWAFDQDWKLDTWGSWTVQDVSANGIAGSGGSDNWLKARASGVGKGAKITNQNGFYLKSFDVFTDEDNPAFLDEVTVTWRAVDNTTSEGQVVDLIADTWTTVTAEDLGVIGIELKALWFNAPGISNPNAAKFGFDNLSLEPEPVLEFYDGFEGPSLDSRWNAEDFHEWRFPTLLAVPDAPEGAQVFHCDVPEPNRHDIDCGAEVTGLNSLESDRWRLEVTARDLSESGELGAWAITAGQGTNAPGGDPSCCAFVMEVNGFHEPVHEFLWNYAEYTPTYPDDIHNPTGVARDSEFHEFVLESDGQDLFIFIDGQLVGMKEDEAFAATRFGLFLNVGPSEFQADEVRFYVY